MTSINKYTFTAKSPIDTSGISRVYLPYVKSVKINGVETFDTQNWDPGSNTYLLKFENNPEGVILEFSW